MSVSVQARHRHLGSGRPPRAIARHWSAPFVSPRNAHKHWTLTSHQYRLTRSRSDDHCEHPSFVQNGHLPRLTDTSSPQSRCFETSHQADFPRARPHPNPTIRHAHLYTVSSLANFRGPASPQNNTVTQYDTDWANIGESTDLHVLRR